MSMKCHVTLASLGDNVCVKQGTSCHGRALTDSSQPNFCQSLALAVLTCLVPCVVHVEQEQKWTIQKKSFRGDDRVNVVFP